MDRLWTPWRRAFVESAGTTENGAGACFLCQKPAESPEADRDNLVLFRGDRAFVLLNLYPYNSGHLMIAPYEHTGDYPGLSPETAHEMTALTQRCVAILTEAYRPEAFNIGMNLGRPAGAGLPDHLHIHVVPRWNGDTNFMPVIGNTKVLPERLEQTYDRLAPYFR